jgi:hypothetical protein
MTREDIIQMAQKAGFVWLGEYHSNLEDFAKLVAQHEREACAKFIEHDYVRQFERPWRDDLSAAIRTMGQA